MEPDEAALAVIAGTLEPYGFIVKNITNGDQAVEFAKKNHPVLMMVSVEPKKIGYAICNKIKRSADLKDVPLILTSGEEAAEKFEQHKTFKLRADEYMFKPIDRYELMRMVNILVGLEAPEDGKNGTASDEIFASGDSISSEITIDADDIVEEAQIPTPPPVSPPSMGNEVSPFAGSPELDAIFDQETQAALDVLELKGQLPDLPVIENLAAAVPPPAEGEDDDGFSEEGATRVSTLESDGDLFAPPPDNAVSALMVDEPTGQSQTPFQDYSLEEPPAPSALPQEQSEESISSQVFPPEPVTAQVPNIDPGLSLVDEIEGDPDLLRKPRLDVPPEPDEVRNTSVFPLGVSPGNESALAELQNRVHDLEDEKRRLSVELEDLQQRLLSQPLSKEKDLLGLRETINRKEKDILDLRDELDAKERQILDAKDRVREHERARRDHEERILAFEKSLMLANEKSTALAQDKEKAIERERGLKTRLDDALDEIAKAHDEVDQLRKRLASSEERARAELDKLRLDLEAKMAENDTSHRDELSRLREEREAEKTAREAEARAEIERLTGNHAAELEGQQKRFAEDKAALVSGHELELSRVRREFDKDLSALREENTTASENQKQSYLAAIEARDRDQKLEIIELRRTHEAELTAAEDRRRRELEAAEAHRTAELDAADARRRSELQAREEQHHAAIADLERRSLAEKNELAERQRVDLDQALARATQMEAELVSRSEDFAETKRRLVRSEGEGDAVRADLRDREVKLGQARDRLAELEAKVADLEDQTLRAYRKIREDDKVMDKAKRALGVALTLLDERSTPQPVTRAGDENQG